MAAQQRSLLSSLLSSSRINRLFDAEVLNGDDAYTVVELVGDIQDGVFSELKAGAPKIDPLRRNLQRAYLDILKREFGDSAPAVPTIPTGRPSRGGGDFSPRVSELRSVARVSPKRLDQQIAAAQGKVKDAATVAHLEDIRAQIHDILEPGEKK